MRDLMPEGGPPVELAGLARRRRVHRQHRPETHTQSAESHQPDGADGEIGVPGEDLHSNRRGWLEAVSLRKPVISLLGQIPHVERKKLRLLCVDDQLKPLRPSLLVLTESIEEIERVLVPNIIWIAVERDLKVAATVFDRTDAKLIHPEQTVAPPRFRVELDSLTGEIDRGVVESIASAQLSERVVEFGVSRIVCEDASTRVFEASPISLEIADGGERSERLKRFRVHTQRPFGFGRRVIVFFQLDVELGEENASVDEVRVNPQAAFSELQGFRRTVKVRAPRHTEECARVVRIDTEDGL